MSEAPARITQRAAELRADFDRAFAEPVRLDATPRENLLAIRVGTEACAIHLADIAGLFADKKITRVPGDASALLGIAGFRGAIVPVFNLQSLLGQPANGTPRWLVMAAAAPVAFAFDAFEGQLRVTPDAIVPGPARAQTRTYARQFVQTQSNVRPIIHLPSIVDAISIRGSDAAPTEER
jgi:purine-binding chemotaxis protein CheW